MTRPRPRRPRAGQDRIDRGRREALKRRLAVEIAALREDLLAGLEEGDDDDDAAFAPWDAHG